MPGPDGSGVPGTGPEFPEVPKEQAACHQHRAPRLVERVTALREQGTGRRPEPKSAIRRRTRTDIYGRDPEIPYVKFEAATCDLVCSLMERQDRMIEEIFYRINDIGYRLDDIEDFMGDRVRR